MTHNGSEMNKTYDPQTVERRLYQDWEQNGYFHAEPNPNKPPFTIVIPPPNITGQLHMGHALDNTMQDIIIRFKRMDGFEALWMPGTDHASIATEVKIVEAMGAEGLTKADLGREGFLQRAWQWKQEYGGRIVNQLKMLGSSCDWARERFTMDEGCSKAVTKAFIDLYNKGLIYRGNRIINWCPDCKTALSDAEVDYQEQASHFWYVRYDAQDGQGSITVATTRPETMLGDTAIAVNPKDERYAHLVGKNVILPLLNKPIPVIADEYVELEFGTGAVKITPAHDPNDFEVGKRHNLPVIRVMNDNGTINALGAQYEGLDRYEARKQMVQDLQACGNLVKIEDYAHNVGECYRCHTTVEPIVSKQWFIDMKPLAKPAIEAVNNGDVQFVPERFSKTYFSWMNNIRDWCISRQLWWGHRIPAYYCKDCQDVVVSATLPTVCPKCGCSAFAQDEDVLDTWFSSGMWPFSTLGWPDETKELEYFYPTNVLCTGYDIIFFWVARMIVFGLEQMHEKPFDTVLIHGIIRDAQGRKMSKSLGNGIDPLEVIEKYGADPLRFSLITGNSPGNDMRFYYEKVESCRNFCNKIWNAARFVTMNLSQEVQVAPIDAITLDISDKWMLTRLNAIISDVSQNLNTYDLGLAAQKLYDFIWSEFCDWYIEMAKTRLYGENAQAKQSAISMLVHTLTVIVKLLHPFMPFITEEIYSFLPNAEKTIMRAAWPKEQACYTFPAETQTMEEIMELIGGVRNLRAQMNVQPGRRTALTLTVTQNIPEFTQALGYIQKLAYGTQVQICPNKPEDKKAVSVVSANAQLYIALEELVDFAKEKERLEKEKAMLEGEIVRANAKLNNAGFVAKAPQKVIDDVKASLSKYEDTLAKVLEKLAQL